MPTKMIVREGTGTQFLYKYPGQVKYRRIPIQITEAAINGIAVAAIPTSHLLSQKPVGGELGGQTFMESVLGDPGTLVLTGFFDPSRPMPKGTVLLKIQYPRHSRKRTLPYVLCQGFFMESSLTMPLSAAMMSTRSVKLSGVIKFFPSKLRTPAPPSST